MKYLDEFSNPRLARGLIRAIKELVDKEEVCLMEVCGTHTVAIFKHGIKQLLPDSIRLLSGPGCPVCVTPTEDVDAAILLSKKSGLILTTFGDMMRVPGSSSSLGQARADGADIRIVYSPLDALEILSQNPSRKVVFFGVGFETTSPNIASTVHSAQKDGVRNFWVYSCHKLIPPAMQALLEAGETKIDGFICPGHVSTIIGSFPYEFIAQDYGVPCVISGFEPLDILASIYMLVKQIKEKRAGVEIQYRRCVRPEGNRKAMTRLYEVFEPTDSSWRGIGLIPNSGLKIKEGYRDFDAALYFEIPPLSSGVEKSGCICKEVLRGVSTPPDCLLFGKGCTPENPVGPCMVSSEGTCGAYYKYGGLTG
ncbi:hydrogenase formation protein HypD [bacterium]|nr:hydrogenase formation protein HypD [bacterium]